MAAKRNAATRCSAACIRIGSDVRYGAIGSMSHLSYGLRGNYWRAFEFPFATKDQWRTAVTGQAANSIRRMFPLGAPLEPGDKRLEQNLEYPPCSSSGRTIDCNRRIWPQFG